MYRSKCICFMRCSKSLAILYCLIVCFGYLFITNITKWVFLFCHSKTCFPFYLPSAQEFIKEVYSFQVFNWFGHQRCHSKRDHFWQYISKLSIFLERHADSCSKTIIRPFVSNVLHGNAWLCILFCRVFTCFLVKQK